MSPNPMERIEPSYDVIVAGARCAGASTAMLLARGGARVLVVDPTRRGTDTLSTHALMRGGALQLARWGLLDEIRRAGTPPVRWTTFHYDDDVVPVEIKARDGVDALYAPRRTLLDRVLSEAAERAGARMAHGVGLTRLLRDADGRVVGAAVAGADGVEREVRAATVVGADGVRSRVARLVEAEVQVPGRYAAASVFGYWPGLEMDGYHWYYSREVAAGAIPTNDGETCVFASVSAERFRATLRQGLEETYGDILRAAAPDLVRSLAESGTMPKLRAFPGLPGFLRRSVGPGWALVGDAGFFRDPITAHGITDALRDAELLARGILAGTDTAVAAYQATRDVVVADLMDATDRVAAFDWTLDEVKELHLAFSRSMAAGVDTLRALDASGARSLQEA